MRAVWTIGSSKANHGKGQWSVVSRRCLIPERQSLTRSSGLNESVAESRLDFGRLLRLTEPCSAKTTGGPSTNPIPRNEGERFCIGQRIEQRSVKSKRGKEKG